MDFNSNYENFDLKLNEEAKGFLQETGKWAYFMSIVGYIMVGLFVLVALFMGSTMAALGGGAGALGGGFISFIYILLALLYFFPIYYLNKFGVKVKKAIAENDSLELTEALKFLKSHYKFIGILTIVMLCIYVAMFLIAIIAGASAFI